MNGRLTACLIVWKSAGNAYLNTLLGRLLDTSALLANLLSYCRLLTRLLAWLLANRWGDRDWVSIYLRQLRLVGFKRFILNVCAILRCCWHLLDYVGDSGWLFMSACIEMNCKRLSKSSPLMQAFVSEFHYKYLHRHNSYAKAYLRTHACAYVSLCKNAQNCNSICICVCLNYKWVYLNESICAFPNGFFIRAYVCISTLVIWKMT